MQQLILGSSSPFRAKLLSKLRLPFIVVSPNINECPMDGESAEGLVLRLSEQKARSIAIDYLDALIISLDQVAILGDRILGKPGKHEDAVKQLTISSGRTVRFLTGLALYNSRTQHMQSIVDTFEVSFKPLSGEQIEFYLQRDKPYECAGSFKSEGLGISLFSRLRGDDPNSLIGLPLIKLIQLLTIEGIDILGPLS